VEFSRTLEKLRKKAGKSRYRLAQLSGLDESFIGRLEKGEKNPSRNTVILLGMALLHDCDRLSLHDIDALLIDAEYAPLHELRFTSRASELPDK
jgi:transcriptional regulator with XRE-family HTH domain